jgi:integrase
MDQSGVSGNEWREVMATVYKKKRDKGKKGACWYFDFTDENGKRCTRKGFTDKGLTVQAASKAENDVMLRRRGLMDPQAEQAAEKKRKPLTEHLDSFERSLSGTTPKHVKQTKNRVRRIIDGCEFATAGDIDAEDVRDWIVEFCEEEDYGNRTYNHYLQAFGSFCNWMVDTKRLAANPITSLVPLNAEVDIRHKRRALSPEEFATLVESARSSDEEIQCFDGETRSRIYILSYMTGLRRKEIASLTPRSFDLAATPPTVTLQAACSKHRRTDVLPLHTELVSVLQDWLKGIAADDPVFPKLARRRTWLMVKKDLARVGIPYETPEGIADFHAAGRHTHITQLLRSGASLPETMKLARHTDVKMTMRYTHIGMDDRAKAVQGLPCQWNGSDSAVSDRPAVSPADAEASAEDTPQKRQNPGGDQGSDADCRSLSSDDSGDCQWRRRELNPRPATFPRSLLRA